MIPSFRPGILSSNRIRKAVVVPASPPCTDCTPNAINWTDLNWFVMGDPRPNNSAQLTGVDGLVNIRLSVTIPASCFICTGPEGFYKVSSSSISSNNYATQPGTWNTFTFTLSGGNYISNTFSVDNNQYVGFSVFGQTDQGVYTVSVQNASSSNTVLDTFNSDNYT